MKQAWLVATAMLAVMVGRAQECRPDVQLLTVYTLGGNTSIPNEVQARARYMAGKVLAGAGVTVKWAKGVRPDDSRKGFCGDSLTIAFDDKAPARFNSSAMAYAIVNAGTSTEIHVFYDRVSSFAESSHMPEFLGHVLAHEIAHILQGVARHSIRGVLKARWDANDCAELTRWPLRFTVEDIKLIHAHFDSLKADGSNTGQVAVDQSK